MMGYGHRRDPLPEVPPVAVPTVRARGGYRASVSSLQGSHNGRPRPAVEQRREPLIVSEARSRHSEALSALASAEALYSDVSRRGDPWATVAAYGRLEAAGRAYVAADGWLLAVLAGRVH